MCFICKYYELDLSDREEGIESSHTLIDIIAKIKAEHPWHYMLAPMSPEERRWYDINSPLRKK